MACSLEALLLLVNAIVEALWMGLTALEATERLEGRHALRVVVCADVDEQANRGLAEAAAILMAEWR